MMKTSRYPKTIKRIYYWSPKEQRWLDVYLEQAHGMMHRFPNICYAFVY